MKIAIGFEGSANKLGVGIVSSDGKILANVRDTYITPPGTGFLPRETGQHHGNFIMSLTIKALQVAKITPKQIDCICYTKGIFLFSYSFFYYHLGPGIAVPLMTVAVFVRTLAQLWKVPIIPVNHCVARLLLFLLSLLC